MSILCLTGGADSAVLGLLLFNTFEFLKFEHAIIGFWFMCFNLGAPPGAYFWFLKNHGISKFGIITFLLEKNIAYFFENSDEKWNSSKKNSLVRYICFLCSKVFGVWFCSNSLYIYTFFLRSWSVILVWIYGHSRNFGPLGQFNVYAVEKIKTIVIVELFCSKRWLEKRGVRKGWCFWTPKMSSILSMSKEKMSFYLP